MQKVILFNGPPGSGKDLSAIILRNMITGKKGLLSDPPYRPEILKFAAPIKAAAHALYNIPYSCEYYEKEFGNDWKDKPQGEFYGLTPREVYISLSEEYMKPMQTPNIFGRLAVRAMKNHIDRNVFIFSDSGFIEEALPVITKVGLDNVILIELTRPGCSFKKDSRGYIGDLICEQLPAFKNFIRLNNDQDQAFLTLLLRGVAMKYLSLPMEL
jgi:hypothetical protein